MAARAENYQNLIIYYTDLSLVQINHMKKFIRQEAHEKAEEIMIKVNPPCEDSKYAGVIEKRPDVLIFDLACVLWCEWLLALRVGVDRHVSIHLERIASITAYNM